jgi:hypothetical protein
VTELSRLTFGTSWNADRIPGLDRVATRPPLPGAIDVLADGGAGAICARGRDPLGPIARIVDLHRGAARVSHGHHMPRPRYG